MGATRPRVVIVGAGFGGLHAAQSMKKLPVDITVVDRRNYHLFQPLLYQVASAGLSPSDIAWPIRGVLSRQKNVSVLLSKVLGIDKASSEVITDSGRLPFDFLILATGARHAYFGNDAWAPYAPGLKSIGDATAIRRRILEAFEHAESSTSDSDRERYLTFVIVGGGPTGVELAGTIAELSRRTLAKDFRRIDPQSARILLIEGSPRLLGTFHESLSEYAREALTRLGVEVRTGKTVSHCDANGVVVDNQEIPAATILWAAGVQASPAGEWLGAESDRAGRVMINKDLTVPGDDRIYVIGDTASLKDEAGNQIPGIAPAAKQQGRFAGAHIAARLSGEKSPSEFRYRDYGSLATIGRKAAVIEYGRLRLKGVLAWWIWGVAHVYFLVGVRSPASVCLQWLWQYLTYGRGARLITGGWRRQPDGTNR